MTKDGAMAKVHDYLKSLEIGMGEELSLLSDQTIEFEGGWVFFYNSKKFLETGAIRDTLAGNAPIIVGKAEGSIQVTGTAYPIEHYIRAYIDARSNDGL